MKNKVCFPLWSANLVFAFIGVRQAEIFGCAFLKLGLFRLQRQTKNIRNKVDFGNIGVDPVSHLAAEYVHKVEGKEALHRSHYEKRYITQTEYIMIDNYMKSESKEDAQIWNLSRMHGYYPCKIIFTWVKFSHEHTLFVVNSLPVALL